MVHTVLQAEHAQQFLRLSVRSGLAVKGQRECYIFPHSQRGDEVEILKNVAEDLPPDPGEFPLADDLPAAEYPSAVKVELTRRRIIKTTEQVHEGGFPRAGRAREGNEIRFLDFQRHPIERVDFLSSPLVGAPEPACFKRYPFLARHTALRIVSNGRTLPAFHAG